MRITREGSALLGLLVAIGCTEPTPEGRTPVMAPSAPVGTAARLRGTVDVAAGTLTFDPVSETGASLAGAAPNAGIYGQQGLTVRLYNSAVVTSAPVAGKRTFTANVGIRNLFNHRIGDEQGAAAPADTMGIYVFVSSGPIVSGTSSPCPACTVTVKNRDGTLDFNVANRPYWYWPEILGPFNGGADTTRVRKPWVFEADTQVTRFNFDVLLNTAWEPPNDSVWKITYPADSLPDTQAEPRWRVFMTPGGPTATINAGLVLSLKKTKDTLVYVRRDSVQAGTSALIEAQLRLDDGGNSAAPQPGLAIDDNTRYIGLFVSDSGNAGRAKVGFINGAGTGFVGAVDSVSAVKSYHVYQLRKYGSDSAVIYIDGARRLRANYTTLPPTKAPAPLPSYFAFGFTAGTVRTTTSTWDYVVYQIGQATP